MSCLRAVISRVHVTFKLYLGMLFSEPSSIMSITSKLRLFIFCASKSFYPNSVVNPQPVMWTKVPSPVVVSLVTLIYFHCQILEIILISGNPRLLKKHLKSWSRLYDSSIGVHSIISWKHGILIGFTSILIIVFLNLKQFIRSL